MSEIEYSLRKQVSALHELIDDERRENDILLEQLQASEAGKAVLCQVLAELVVVATGYEPSEDRYQEAVKAGSQALRAHWRTEGAEVSQPDVRKSVIRGGE